MFGWHGLLGEMMGLKDAPQKRIGTGRSASVHRWREVAIAASTLVTAQRMQQVIADFDAGPKSGSGKRGLGGDRLRSHLLERRF